ncbi:MAG: hypothetical protein R3D05_21815 [Dongiaceae bacterium]
MITPMRRGKLLPTLGLVACLGCLPSAVAAEAAESDGLQIYGLTLDETRLGDGFCAVNESTDLVRQECAQSRQTLPAIAAIDVQTTPAPHVTLTLAPTDDGRPRDLRIWYEPRELGGQAFMIETATRSISRLSDARSDVLAAFGSPTIEFTHADMEARGIRVSDLTVDTLLFVDHSLPDARWTRIAHRLRVDFNPTGAELFSLTNSTLRTLARLLGADFRGAIVQISESGWSHESSVTTILLDLNRAQSIFRLAP